MELKGTLMNVFTQFCGWSTAREKALISLHIILSSQWHIFIIPNGAHLKFSKHAGDRIFSALVDFVVSSEISKLEAKSMFGLVI